MSNKVLNNQNEIVIKVVSAPHKCAHAVAAMIHEILSEHSVCLSPLQSQVQDVYVSDVLQSVKDLDLSVRVVAEYETSPPAQTGGQAW